MSSALTFSKTKALPIIVAFLGFCFVSGCSKSKEPVGSLSGVLTVNGEVCGDCRIEIVGVDSRLSIGGIVDSEGAFALSQIPFDDYQVAVRQKGDRHKAGAIDFDKKIPEKYRSTATSGFSVSISSTEPVELTLEMKSD